MKIHRHHITLLLQLAWAAAWLYFKSHSLLAYCGKGFFAIGVYLGVMLFMYGRLPSWKQLLLFPSVFFGLWLLGAVMHSNPIPGYPSLDPVLGAYIQDFALGGAVLCLLAILKKIWSGDSESPRVS